jgi:hypothetical protein
MESLSLVGSLESFRVTLTKNLSSDCCFCLLFRISRNVRGKPAQLWIRALSRQTSSTRIAKHRSFIKSKFLQNFCSSCKTLADQVARNPRFYCKLLQILQYDHPESQCARKRSVTASSSQHRRALATHHLADCYKCVWILLSNCDVTFWCQGANQYKQLSLSLGCTRMTVLPHLTSL